MAFAAILAVTQIAYHVRRWLKEAGSTGNAVRRRRRLRTSPVIRQRADRPERVMDMGTALSFRRERSAAAPVRSVMTGCALGPLVVRATSRSTPMAQRTNADTF